MTLLSLTTLLLIVSLTTSAYASDKTTNQIDKIMSFDYAGDSLTPEQLEYLAKDPELAAKRAEKDVKFLIDKAEKQMNDSMKKDKVSGVGILTVTIPIGQDTTVSDCEVGNKNGSKSGLLIGQPIIQQQVNGVTFQRGA